MKNFENFDENFAGKVPATWLAMAPNSYAYIRMKAEYMCQLPMLRKLKNHA